MATDEPKRPVPAIGVFEPDAACFVCGNRIPVAPSAIAVTDTAREAEKHRYTIFFAHAECVRPFVHSEARAEFDAAC